MSWDWEYPAYEPVAKKRAKAEKALIKLKKKDPNISPVIIEGRKIARTWWGVAWNKNLESYADYDNRIGRGRSYVKNGMILDLKIETGLVTALVMGSGTSPYKVEIKIDKLPKTRWNRIVEECSHRIGGMAELAAGKFPEDLADMFLQQGNGLFPSPREIHLRCDCYDWANMCKHVAATLYGIGARFDEDPLLFFNLRDIPFEDLLRKSVEEKMQNMLKNADKKSARILEGENLSEIFGI